ncbi:MAG: hypothetical protein ACRDZP_09020 [Acidimicrobiales bacterium]
MQASSRGPSGSGPGPISPLATRAAASSSAANSSSAAERPQRGAVIGAVCLAPFLLVALYLEIVASVADSLDDLQAHKTTGLLWLAFFALLGICGPVAAAVATWNTRADGGRGWRVVLRAEMAMALVGAPAALLLIML